MFKNKSSGRLYIAIVVRTDKLPGPPQNVHVDVIDSHTVLIKWDPPIKNPNTIDVYR